MKSLLFTLFLLGTIWISSCTSAPTQKGDIDRTFLPYSSPQLNRMTDPRDGEVYATVKIGQQIWMAENLRYKAKGSWINSENPLPHYGRLYDGKLAQTVCPSGWHLPSDAEWNEMEMTLGMPPADTTKTSWRGTHGTKMKSITGWAEGGNGTNSSGFNGLPHGYYFRDNDGGDFDGGGSAGYWASMEGSKAWLRFLGGPLEGVNRFADHSLTWGLACRCVKN